jgi:N-acetylated-alpha-linked acidic dipeptidase
LNQAVSGATGVSQQELQTINSQLAMANRKLISETGLPGRPWVKNLIYAPGTYAGYGVKTIPGVREALEQDRYPEAKQQLAVVSRAIDDEAAYLEKISVEFGSSHQPSGEQ